MLPNVIIKSPAESPTYDLRKSTISVVRFGKTHSYP